MYYREPRHPRPDDLRLIEQATNLAQIAIERHQMESSLTNLMQRLELILNSAGEGIFGLDLKGRVTFANPAMAAMLGLRTKDMLGQEAHAQWHHSRADGTSYPIDESPMYAAFKGGQTHSRDDEVFWRKDGLSFPVEYTSTPIVDQGAIIGCVVVCRDITERKRAEESLRQASAERERISQDLHDGILQSLYAVGLGLAACKPLLAKNPRQAAAAFEGAVAQLNHVMREVRHFITGLESDPLEGMDLPAALREMVSSLSQAQGTRIRLSVDAKAAQAVSHSQALHLMNVVKEAISNSVRHGQAREATVSLKLVKGGVRLAIRDNGTGFDPDHVSGEGHGLANMAARAEKLGGHFSIVSKPKAGTRVVFDVPKESPYASA
jgi:PAS domain S-box-containing protein